MSNIPKLRFPEFTDAWEKCKLGKIVKERNEQYPKSNEYPLMAFISGQGIADKGERYNRDFLVSDEESKKYKRTELDDFIYSSNNLETGSIGLNRYGKACISPVYSIFYIDKSNDPYFIGQRLIQKDFIYQMTRYRQGVVYGQWRIHEKDFLKLSIIRPALPEQQKIGNLFKQLDRLITLHKRKWDDVILLKKALLQKMFPKNGSDFPEIRFPEFTDAWEKCKLGSIAKRVKGNDGDMSLPTLTISAGSGWLSQKERFSGNIAGTEQKNYTLLKKGQLSYNHGNSKVAKYGAVFVLKTYEKALVPRVYHSFEMNKNGCADFIEVLFATKLPDRELVKKITSGARTDGLLNISFEGFMDINIKIPTLPEQQKIGNLFKQLDRLITLHKRQHEHYQLLKKALLQQMFV
ncbi:restriction endonuclease subunit S [Gallibacterium anatis]|uniref:restriction endonuclease subunit S n=1 Tax=Gallibacterium anatis TaxID=750 RepID=UPI0039FC41C8